MLGVTALSQPRNFVYVNKIYEEPNRYSRITVGEEAVLHIFLEMAVLVMGGNCAVLAAGLRFTPLMENGR